MGLNYQVNISKRVVNILLCTIFLSFFSCQQTPTRQADYDIIIYGGTSGGIAAAIQGSRMGKKVLLLEPSSRLGGLTTGGLGQTDIGNKIAIGGIAREFYQNIKAYYENPSNWKWEKKTDYKSGGQSKTDEGEDAMWTFEPSVALKVYDQMIAAENFDLVSGKRLMMNGGVIKSNNEITEITMEDGTKYSGLMFIDATYEGDLMAASGVSYTVGREANSLYGETFNGVQLMEGHQFPDGIDPYIVSGNPESGLLWGISSDTLMPEGSGDKLVQAYNFRICLTDNPENRIPITRPDNYDSTRYELLVRLFEAQPQKRKLNDFFIWSMMPNRKTDINNKGAFSTDMIGENYDFPEASWQKRKEIQKKHEDYTKGLLYFYTSDPRVPEELKSAMQQWGYPKDEYTESGNWSPQLYVREARRLVGAYVMNQANCVGEEVVKESIGLAAYTMDSHNCQRIVVDGQVKNEGNVEKGGFPPYPIAYRSILPKKEEATNLLVPTCLSASHIAFGSIRMEPVFMILGQSATIAAVLALEEGVDLHELSYEKFEKELLNVKQKLAL